MMALALRHFTGRVEPRQARLLAALASIATLAAVAPFFAREIAEAVRAWVDSPTYNHCFLVIPLVLYLLWNRRGAVAEVAPRPDLRGLVAICVFSIIWFAAAKLDVIEARQFLFMGIVQGILFTLLGSALYMRLLGPLLYLFFLVPSGQFLVPKLQDVTANLAITGLHAAGVRVYSDGIFIEIPEGSFVIAEACAGLRFLVASIAYGVLFALLVYVSWWRRLAFVGLSLVIPVIANGIRAFGIIFGAHLIGSAAAIEADHILYGWIFFSIVIFLLTLVGMSFSDKSHLNPDGSTTGFPTVFVGTPAKFWLVTIIIVALLAVSGPSMLMFTRGGTLSPDAAWLDLPKPLPPWRQHGGEPDWRPALAEPDREFIDVFSDGQTTVERYVALFVSHGDDNIVRNLGRGAPGFKQWERGNIKIAGMDIAGRPREVALSEIRAEDGRRRQVLSFYIVDGKTVATVLRAKLLETYASLTGGGRAVAYFAISVPIGRSDTTLEKFLESMPTLDRYVGTMN
jgi:exosortase A